MLLELCCASALLAAPAAPGAAQPTVETRALLLRADRILLGDGTTIDQGAIVIENGRIQACGKDLDAPEGAGVVTHSGWISAGLVALHAYAGAPDEMRDSTRPVLDAKVAWAFDPAHPDF